MRVAEFSLAVDPLLPVASAGQDVARLAVYDDPEEWGAFSQRLDPANKTISEASGPPAAETQGLWESQVVVRGMHCAACALTLEQALLAVRGVSAVRVSAASARASVSWSPAQTLPSRWMTAVLPLGYELLPAALDVR